MLMLLYGWACMMLYFFHKITAARAAGLEAWFERKCTETVGIVNELELAQKTEKPSPVLLGKLQMKLALAAVEQEAAEVSYMWWAGAAERVAGWYNAVTGYRNNCLSYTLAKVDVAVTAGLLTYFGLVEVDATELQNVLQTARVFCGF